MDEQEVAVETLLEKEAAVLRYLEENAPSNPKKLKQLVKKMYNDYPIEIQKGLFRRLLISADPVARLKQILDLMNEWYDVVPGLIATGYHGMIIKQLEKGKEVHGFSVDTLDKWLNEKIPWTTEQEIEIQVQALRLWMEKSNLLDFTGKVVCFSSFGFSGAARSFHVVNGVPQTKVEKVVRSDKNKYLKGLNTSQKVALRSS